MHAEIGLVAYERFEGRGQRARVIRVVRVTNELRAAVDIPADNQDLALGAAESLERLP